LHWPAIIHILDTLRAQPLHIDATKAWKLIDAVYKNNTEMLLNIKKPIFAALGSLCLKAFSARQAALATENKSLPSPPEYITKLRERRDEARARSKAGTSRSRGKRRSTLILKGD